MYSMPHLTVDVRYATFNGGCTVCHLPVNVEYATFDGGRTDAKYLWMYIMPHLTVDGSVSQLTLDVQMPRNSGCTLYHI